MKGRGSEVSIESAIEHIEHIENAARHQRLGAFAVMSVNLNGQTDWYKDEPMKQWSTRAPVARAVVASEYPEVVGIQEFGETTREDVFDAQEEIPYEVYQGERVGDIFINPIAWDGSRYTAAERFTHWLTPDGRFGKAWDGIERGYSAVLLESNAGGKPLWVYNAHLDNVSALARAEGTKLLLKDIEERTEDVPVVITGDFNFVTWPVPASPDEGYYEAKAPLSAHSDRETIRRFEAAGFTDAGSVATDRTLPEPTFHGYRGRRVYEQPDTFGTWNPDRIFVRQLGVLAFKIITAERDGVFPSDHYPIQATVTR